MADDYSPAAGAFSAVNEERTGTGQDSEKKSFYLRRFCKVERFVFCLGRHRLKSSGNVDLVVKQCRRTYTA